MFDGIYEDDGPDEEPETDIDSSEEDGGDGSGSGSGSSGEKDESKFQAKIFILPMKHLDKAFDRNGN